MKKEKAFLNKFLIIFLYCQPFLDVLTSFQKHYFNTGLTIGVIIRFCFLLTIGILFLRNKEKKPEIFYLLTLGIYILLFTGSTLYHKDRSVLFFELKNLIHILYFPITYLLLRKLNPDQIDSKHFIRIYFIYLLFLIIPSITHTSFEGYFQGKIGNVGWFYATNEISAILCILMPFVFHFLLSSKQNIAIKIIYFLCMFYALFALGTKMTVLIFGILILICVIKLFKMIITEKKQTQLMILSSLCIFFLLGAILVIPKSSFFYNMKIHLEFLDIHTIQDVFKNDRFINHFIFSERLTFLKNTHQNYVNAPLDEKLLGIGYIENYKEENENQKTIEMDYFDIFYRCGIIGSILTILPFINKKEKKKRNVTTYGIWIALFIAGFSGHVFTAPAVSIYVIMLLLNKEKELPKTL